ncbi:unnamed protein product [Rhizophagus irregularis]|uniref:Uncharacterized protein n=1 Tax=Rhizophagus irregularis TaxID=588596 RepID=A0A2N1NJF4_9GLOM|nr:hypothetical protein RhiirC2_739693 [Rhizophagus irregularis]CAB4388571.1 unnamed protein product [Rhizophagus irregularis]CAB5381418.1 unnamed protein product [Rhizophagus irregularis]
MQTTKVDNVKNNMVTIVKPITNPIVEDILPTQVEDMSDIPGIRVSMATIVDSSPFEEQQKLSYDNTPNDPKKVKKVINKFFSSTFTLPEEQHQIKPSKVSTQRKPQSTELTEASVRNETSDASPAIDITNKTNEDSEVNDVEYIQNSSKSQSLQNVQVTQQPVIIYQNNSQQLSKQNPNQITNNQTTQVFLPDMNGTIPSIEVPPPQLQQLSIPLVQNASGAIGNNVQLMNGLNTSSGNYKNVPSPSTLTTSNGTLAVKLLNNKKDAQQGVKRSHISYNSYDYYRGKDFKRVAYDSGSSRPEYDSGVSSGGNSGNGSIDSSGGGSKSKHSYGFVKR